MKRTVLALIRILSALAEPRSATDDARRREFVLNTLLLGVLALSVTALAQVLIGIALRGGRFEGASPWVVVVIIGVLLMLYGLSRRGHSRIAAHLLVVCFALIAVAVCLMWGVLLPAGPLMFVLVIVMSGTLVGARFSLVVTGLISLVMLGLAYLQSEHLARPNLSWMSEGGGGLNDAFGYIFIWGIIALVAWLSNRELERSLRRARVSEADLARQRDLLEERVEERTRELKQAQLEKLLQLNRFADFGRISSGFFHDIINPLTAVSLNLEQLSTKKRSELLKHAIAGIRRIEDFAVAARKQVQGHDDEQGEIAVADEVREVAAVLESKARGAGVVITCDLDEKVSLLGSPVKFHQLVSNLIANAIDAYEGTPLESRLVSVAARRRGKMLKLTVKDQGNGIQPEHLAMIFDPFFTTKPITKGTGIGLMIVKQIIEDDFKGTISVTSTKRAGTVFTVQIPVPE
jgi:signal transduction histidine kinase